MKKLFLYLFYAQIVGFYTPSFGFDDNNITLENPKLSIIGTGYVGLVTGPCMAEYFDVIGVDNNKERIETLQQGKVPFYEPGLEEIIQQGALNQRLSFTTNTKEAVEKSNIAMVCVGTPSNDQTGEADLSYIYQASKDIAQELRDDHYTLVVIKSTVPVGTCEEVSNLIENARPDLKKGIHFGVASNPEFLREGCAVEDFMHPDRIVVGVESVDEKAKALIQKLYQPFTDKGYPLVITDLRSSELCKYASNFLLALRLSAVNQLSDLSSKVDANIEEVMQSVGLDKRIGPLFLKSGPGYGGSCFPKDTLALDYMGKKNGVNLSLVKETIDYNTQRKFAMAERVMGILNKDFNVQTPNLAVFGITFKAGTDDLREAPALTIIPELLKKGAHLTIYDPLYNNKTGLKKPDWAVEWGEDLYTTTKGKDGALILTEWEDFKTMNLEALAENLKTPLLIDLRNLFDLNQIKKINYYSLGRKNVFN